MSSDQQVHYQHPNDEKTLCGLLPVGGIVVSVIGDKVTCPKCRPLLKK